METPERIAGIHHVTAVAGDPAVNRSFYTGLLGLRLVKRTVNFDAPESWHLYYGDREGRPGTTLTFFSWPELPEGRRGRRQVTAVALAVPEDSLGWWAERLEGKGVRVEGPRERHGRRVATLLDPEGLRLELVETTWASRRQGWGQGDVPGDQAVRGVEGVEMTVGSADASAALLEDAFGLERRPLDGERTRFTASGGGPGRRLDLVAAPTAPAGRVARGSVHHVAFRTPDEETQGRWRRALDERGLAVTPVRDRHYFRSVYFREPGGVLFEIATEEPGFTLDEDVEGLGSGLRLPPWLEDRREEIEGALPPLEGG
jgi:glyoxalase family protein